MRAAGPFPPRPRFIDILPAILYIFAFLTLMATENVRERKEKRHFTVVLISGTDSTQTRTFSASLWKLIGILVASLAVITALVVAAIVYTPIGSRLPIANPALEAEYGRQILEIRERMVVLFEQLNALRGYNARLRQALGETLTPADSALIASGRAGMSAQGDGPTTGIAEASGDTAADGAGSSDGRTAADGGSARTVDRAAAEQANGGAGTSDPAMQAGMPPDDPGDRNGEGAASEGWTYPLSQPAQGFVTRGFEPGQYHYGIDYAAKEGSTVIAAAGGHVIFAGWTGADGNMLMISHPGGLVTVYKHNKALLKSTGDPVRRGEPVALVGNTGRSSGPHLHFEVWKNGIARDAAEYLVTIQ